MVYKTGNNLENYPLINAVCLIVLHQFFFCHGDFPVSRNGQSDGNIKVGLRIADAGPGVRPLQRRRVMARAEPAGASLRNLGGTADFVYLSQMTVIGHLGLFYS